MSVIGIDPGIMGAIAYNDGGVIEVIDTPSYTVTVGTGKSKKERTRLDAVELYEHLAMLKFRGVSLAVMEKVGGRPGESPSGAFQFGWAAALVYMALIALEIPIKVITPQEWKKDMGVPGKRTGKEMTDADKKAADKEAKGMIIQRADEIMPAYRQLWRGDRGGHKLDRAEAALLSVYGATHVKQETWNHERYKDLDA